MMPGYFSNQFSHDPRYINNQAGIVPYTAPGRPYLNQVPQYGQAAGYEGMSPDYYGQHEAAGLPQGTAGYYPVNPYQGFSYHQGAHMQTNPYQSQYQGYVPQQMPYGQYPQSNPFENPLKPQQGNSYGPNKQMHPGANPYPSQNFMQKQQSSGFSSIMNQFKTQDGSFDINKMMSTAGQMMNTMNQVSSIVKGFGGLFKVTT
ncbi:YppG family protein [Peribacillus sp. SCS-37]|uniref:YppG family protein n=1 Tax=Paraperibacillus esterisolvens TaxID=3115296 RepID=UPI00390585EA